MNNGHHIFFEDVFGEQLGELVIIDGFLVFNNAVSNDLIREIPTSLTFLTLQDTEDAIDKAFPEWRRAIGVILFHKVQKDALVGFIHGYIECQKDIIAYNNSEDELNCSDYPEFDEKMRELFPV